MKSSSRARSYRRCFICREWGWDVSKPTPNQIGADLCLPCYVDVLQVRQARGVMGKGSPERTAFLAGNPPEDAPETGNSPSSFRQMDLFD